MIYLKGREKPKLESYSDAGFAGDPPASRSTSGFLIKLKLGAICWKSNLQRDVILSTTKAKYQGDIESCCQLFWKL